MSIFNSTKKWCFLLSYLFFTFVSTAQTPNKSLNKHLQEMEQLFIEGNYLCYVEYTYERVFDINDGIERPATMSADGMEQIKAEGFTCLEVKFKKYSPIIAYQNQLQLTLTFEVIMDLLNGEVKEKYCVIGLSKNDGQTWQFIDTGGAKKELAHKFFSNLSGDFNIFDKKKQKKINTSIDFLM